jgi:steroid 5-alpha reductase family enzyme
MERSRAASFGWIVTVYAVAGVVGWLAIAALGDAPTWRVMLIGDVAATIVVFGASVVLDNSSVYDPYWSIAPMVFAPWLALDSVGSTARRVLVTALVLAWGARLTWNWARGWSGLSHEDWRYVEIRGKTGALYWPVSFVGIHLMPTVLVYLGSLALVPALSSAAPLGPLDVAASAVTLGAIVVESAADEQLRAFRRSGPPAGTIMARGLWAWSRHPNYLGEIGFWWGLGLFAVAAEPGAWRALAGTVAITSLFVFISVPLIDRRSLARRPAYAAHMRRVPGLVPRPWRRRASRGA